MATLTFYEFSNIVEQSGAAFASAWSEGAIEFTRQVALEGGRNVVAAERQAEILAQTLGSKILQEANKVRLIANDLFNPTSVLSMRLNIGRIETLNGIF